MMRLELPDLSWVAKYSGGYKVEEAQATYSNLERGNLEEFSLVDEKGTTYAHVKLEKGEVLFYRRRTFAVGTPLKDYLYLLGCRKRNELGEVQTRIYIIFSNGRILEDNVFQKQWFEPQWMPQETV